jgi:phosphopantetheinyl transferase (holo-ACP synthase)
VFLKEDELKGIGLDIPYVARIASALREKGLNVADDVIRLDELEEAVKRLIPGGCIE